MENVYIGSNLLTLGNKAFVNIGGFLDGSAPIILGEGVALGPYVKILTGSHLLLQNVIRTGECMANPVVIERGCWIGMNASIMPGVTVAEGCVIAAGAVVVTSTNPNGLYAGIPARRIKDLPVS